MAQENINKFFEIIQNAQAIAQKFDEIIEKFQGEEQNQKLVEFAQELGVEITPAELEAANAQVQDLDDQQLDDVVGGYTLKPGQVDVDFEYRKVKKQLELHLRQKRQQELAAMHEASFK